MVTKQTSLFLPEEPLSFVLVCSDQDAVVVNLDNSVLEDPEGMYWIDQIHVGTWLHTPTISRPLEVNNLACGILWNLFAGTRC